MFVFQTGESIGKKRQVRCINANEKLISTKAYNNNYLNEYGDFEKSLKNIV